MNLQDFISLHNEGQSIYPKGMNTYFVITEKKQPNLFYSHLHLHEEIFSKCIIPFEHIFRV